jgi:hypothetical protein
LGRHYLTTPSLCCFDVITSLPLSLVDIIVSQVIGAASDDASLPSQEQRNRITAIDFSKCAKKALILVSHAAYSLISTLRMMGSVVEIKIEMYVISDLNFCPYNNLFLAC